MNINLEVLPEPFSIFKVESRDILSEDIKRSSFHSITESADEISVICEKQYAPVGTSPVWSFMRFSGSLDDEIVGVVANITKPLADQGVSVLVNTTYDAGYFGVPSHSLIKAIEILGNSGFTINEPS